MLVVVFATVVVVVSAVRVRGVVIGPGAMGLLVPAVVVMRRRFAGRSVVAVHAVAAGVVVHHQVQRRRGGYQQVGQRAGESGGPQASRPAP